MSRPRSAGGEPAQAPAVGGAARSAAPGAVLFRERVGPADDAFEREADRIADLVVRGGTARGLPSVWAGASTGDGAIQRKCAECEAEEEETIRRAPRDAALVQQPGAPGAEPGPDASARESATDPDAAGSAAPSATSGSLLVDDDGETRGGQMRKSEFLSALRGQVCVAVDGALEGSGRDSQGCPWIDHWFGYYEGQSAAQLERSVRRYAPEARAATGPHEYIRAVTACVRESAERYATTGEIGGLPSDMPDGGMPGGDIVNAFGGMFFKARPGGARHAAGHSPASVRDQLGSGRSLPGEARSRMESAFGTSFSRVRLHTDSGAARLADRLNARAFTIGEHVAFSAGEYRPDSLTGQALLAHELAHVVQQGGAARMQRSARSGDHASAALEQDADTTAVRAVVSIVSGTQRGLAKVRETAMPRLKSGLRLQRCGRHDPVPSSKPEIEATDEALGKHAVACMIQANKGPKSKTSGIWYPHGYKAKHPDEWEDDYINGYANSDYWERTAYMQWRLKSGRSASAGVKAWLKGLTIAECYSTAIVSEVDSIRAAIGDAKFDELYGSEDKAVTPRLEMGMNGSTALARGELKYKGGAGGIGTIGNRPASVGEWHYFFNHPQYLLKHPAGVYQGENAMLREDRAPNGDQLWEGLGQAQVTERQMYMNMMADYNRDRNKWDEEKLDRLRQANGGTLPPQYDLKSGVFPEKLNSYEDILNAPEYTVDGTKRKGGYYPGARKGLDPEEVKKRKGAP